MEKRATPCSEQSQRQKFFEAARKTGADESEEAFEAKLKKIAAQKPKNSTQKK